MRASGNDYTYSNSGQRLTNTITDDQGVQRTEQYTYDRLSRLTGVNYGDGEVQSYTFDPMGNRLTKTVNGIPEGYTYNNANMLLTRGAASYTNDANGNTLTDGASNRSMAWDSQNRMASCTYAGQTSTFTYGADGLRRRMVTGANTTDYLLDGQSVVREIKNGVIDATYLVGPRGPEYKRDQNGAVQWYLYDGLGSVVGLVDSSGNVTNTRKYDVYGAPRNAQTGSAHCFVGGLGHTSDAETGLIYMRARYMDPSTGRFVGEDLARDGANWFVYCGSAPTCGVDATGQFFTAADVAMSVTTVVEGAISGALDAFWQWCHTGRVNGWEVGLAFGQGMLFGGLARLCHYATRAGIAKLTESAFRCNFRAFWEYTLKGLGIGSSTSSVRMGLFPIWRSLLSSNASHLFAVSYNSYLDAIMTEE